MIPSQLTTGLIHDVLTYFWLINPTVAEMMTADFGAAAGGVVQQRPPLAVAVHFQLPRLIASGYCHGAAVGVAKMIKEKLGNYF